MEIRSGETKTFNTKYGEIKITNAGDIQLNMSWANGKENGFLNLRTGDCNIPQNILNEVLAQL